jgi:hypothetical protein
LKTIRHENVYVCFLDVLGFKDLINNNDHDVLDRIFDSKIIRAINEFNHDDIDIFRYERVNTLSVSDSIVLWTNDASPNSMINIVYQTKSVMLSCLLNGIPLRGAIACGPISVKKQDGQTIIIGKALTRAYELEGKQNWSGCVIDENLIKNSNHYDYMLEKHLIFDYQVPYKAGPIVTQTVIDWVSNAKEKRWIKHSELSRQAIEQAFSRHNKKTDNWDVRIKIDNTLSFFSTINGSSTLQGLMNSIVVS